ncbi:hypothetical protein PVAG01_00880 [Phlyctema vagabunda]|uniref:Uncharacterized protein n=1 Tax=Phlyctema vagabunda TaxID=108571 RepID=A0ABR4PWV6_9HELO
MLNLLPSQFVLQSVTPDDMTIASLCWGFTLGFGFLTVWAAIKQTTQVRRTHGLSRLTSPYITMIWAEISVCLSFSIICWLHLRGVIPPSFAFYFCIRKLWALQVQFLLQIIINRVMILLVNRSKGSKIRILVAVLITSINVSVYCIWIPARLQISERYIHLNEIWDRCEKGIYLLVDGALNWYFIQTVQKNLVCQGLTKYKNLVKFNMYLVFFSLTMDVLIISMMSLKNSFVYMQFHPLAYIVKLKIEMSMADLISKVSRMQNPKLNHSTLATMGNQTVDIHDNVSKGNVIVKSTGIASRDWTQSFSSQDIDHNSIELGPTMPTEGGLTPPPQHELRTAYTMYHSSENINGVIDDQDMRVHTTKEVVVRVERSGVGEVQDGDTGFEGRWEPKTDDDQRPLRSPYGVSTKVWKG